MTSFLLLLAEFPSSSNHAQQQRAHALTYQHSEHSTRFALLEAVRELVTLLCAGHASGK